MQCRLAAGKVMKGIHGSMNRVVPAAADRPGSQDQCWKPEGMRQADDTAEDRGSSVQSRLDS